MATWYLTQPASGPWTVRKDRSGQTSEHPSEDDAMVALRKRYREGDRVVLVEPDGYRTPITRRLRRRR